MRHEKQSLGGLAGPAEAFGGALREHSVAQDPLGGNGDGRAPAEATRGPGGLGPASRALLWRDGLSDGQRRAVFAIAAALATADRELWDGLPVVFRARLNAVEVGRLAVASLAALGPVYGRVAAEAAGVVDAAEVGDDLGR